jgi:hypothetical protein
VDVFEFIFGIALLLTIASIARAKINARAMRRQPPQDGAEARQLREEVARLKDRLAVIERITVERENSLERQIEALRDR